MGVDSPGRRSEFPSDEARQTVLLWEIRDTLGLSRAQLAEILDLDVDGVEALDQGRTIPSGEVRRRLNLLLEICDRARSILGADEVPRWFNATSPALGDDTPRARANRAGGLEDIRGLLINLEWGIPG